MAPKQLLVKRHGHLEEFDERKIYASIYATALNAHFSEQASEELAKKVTTLVTREVRKKDTISAHQIRKLVLDELGPDTDVGFLFEHHLDIN